MICAKPAAYKKMIDVFCVACLHLLSHSAADKGHFLVVTPPHLRTSYNVFFLEDGCIGIWKRMVVSLSSL